MDSGWIKPENMTPENYYTDIPLLASFVRADKVLLDFFNEGGLMPDIIAKVYDVKCHPNDPDAKDVIRIEAAEVIVAADSFCKQVVAAESPMVCVRDEIKWYGCNYNTRAIQLITGVAFALLKSKYKDAVCASWIAEWLDKEYCRKGRSYFRYGKSLVCECDEPVARQAQKAESIIPEKVKDAPAETSTQVMADNIALIDYAMNKAKELSASVNNINVNISLNGNNIGYKSNENYGDNYSVMPGAKIERKEEDK